MKRVLFFVLVGAVCYLLSLRDERRSVQVLPMVDAPVSGEPTAPAKIEGTKVAGGRLNTFVPFSLSFTTLQKQRFQVAVGPKTSIVWHNVDKGERIVLTPETATEFVKSRHCWVLVGVHKGVASDIIIHPVMDINEFPDLK